MSDAKEKLTLEGIKNTTIILGQEVQFVIRNNYITFYDFTMLQVI